MSRGDVRLAIRPERVLIEDHDSIGDNRVSGTIDRVVYVGPVIQVHVRLAQGTSIQAMLANRGAESVWPRGCPVTVHLPPDALRIIPEPQDPQPGATGAVR